MINILITGCSGMLGASLSICLSKYYRVYTTGRSESVEGVINYKPFDLLKDCYKELIDWSQPELIIHCAALTNGNYCEKNPSEAFNINGISVNKFLNSTNKNVSIIYISTDAVFPSSLGFAKESDCVFPESVYGKSKELGEFFLKASLDRNYTIIRTTIVGLNINKKKSGFVEWIINTVNNNQQISLFTDVLFTPITIWDLAEEIKFLIRTANVKSKTLHIGGEICTKFHFGKKLLDGLCISTEKLAESSISSLKDRAKRSSDQSLDSSYYEKNYDRSLPNLNKTIKNIIKHYEGH
ncbi:sugar nucleotide-binding protein [Akkermansiaceae bacterium]|nr:sugar nucleotide-binding protein [Akkermansiaceae bacterium]